MNLLSCSKSETCPKFHILIIVWAIVVSSLVIVMIVSELTNVKDVRFNVFTVLKIQVMIWVVMSCSDRVGCQYFR